VDLATELQPIEAQPNQPSLLAYATDYRIARHELDIEVARERSSRLATLTVSPTTT
jgi:hypothetical protein